MKRTLRQTLEHIVKRAEHDMLGARSGINCVYEDVDGRRCGIGCLMTRKELDAVHAQDLNDTEVGTLAYLGLFSLSNNSLTLAQAVALQCAHDELTREDAAKGQRKFAQILRQILKKGRGLIRAISFEL